MLILNTKQFTIKDIEYYSIATIEGKQVRLRIYHNEEAQSAADNSSFWFPSDPKKTHSFDEERFRSIARKGPIKELINASISGFKTQMGLRGEELNELRRSKALSEDNRRNSF